MDSIGYLGIFVVLVGLGWGLWSWRGHARAKAQSQAAERWPSAPGRVLEAAALRRQGGGSRHRYSYYVPAIRYLYTVNGREREGTRLRFGMPTSRSQRGMEEMLAPYPAGAEVAVRYDPEKPEESVLDPATVGSNLFVSALASTIVLALGLGIVVLALKGVFSADVSGRWLVDFEAGGVAYDGELQAERGAGPLTLSLTDAEGPKRIREHCTLTRRKQNVSVHCVDPQFLAGSGRYTPDDFELRYEGGSRLVGSVMVDGAPAGAATFTRS